MRCDFTAAGRAKQAAKMSIQKPEMIVYTGHRTHSGTRVACPHPVLYCYGRGDSLDAVDPGTGGLLDEKSGIRRQAFHVAALALGKQGIESQGRLPRTTYSGHYNQRAFGNVYID